MRGYPPADLDRRELGQSNVERGQEQGPDGGRAYEPGDVRGCPEGDVRQGNARVLGQGNARMVQGEPQVGACSPAPGPPARRRTDALHDRLGRPQGHGAPGLHSRHRECRDDLPLQRGRRFPAG